MAWQGVSHTAFPWHGISLSEKKTRRTNDPNYERTHRANYRPTKDRASPLLPLLLWLNQVPWEPPCPSPQLRKPRNPNPGPQLAPSAFILLNSRLTCPRSSDISGQRSRFSPRSFSLLTPSRNNSSRLRYFFCVPGAVGSTL